ncbi:MAG: tRNA cyclic N6-threonylcarbamoyladenosine(37) synthase TcdA [Gammaproteobacteria bacterium]|nr:tRNA cyclic N6-threonylcarbamoyladenosine(37) synthase TcdA [Gammaproteobacteria bacterium]
MTGERFAGIRRVYGSADAGRLAGLHICVVGIGGVGSWAAEALARTGVGRVTLIDNDDVAESNINRQVHALGDTVGRQKVEVMGERMLAINPIMRVDAIDDFLTMATMETYVNRGYHCVVDAIDSIKFKTALIHSCRRSRIPVVVTGGAGGKRDPSRIQVADLSRTSNDALVARVRKQLRQDYGFPRNPKRAFGVPCVFSTEAPVYPRGDGSVSPAKPGIHGVSLDCSFGYGAVSTVTATFGFFAAATAMERALRRVRLMEAGGPPAGPGA